MTEEYRVRLEAFEGPLDLLLFLIRRAEVDVHDIPIARITEQYFEHLRGVERIDIELAGEFLVMAATLMEIKSRMLMPAQASGAGEGSEGPAPGVDPRAGLVEQLLAYKKFRDAADALEQRRQVWERRFPTRPAWIDDERLRAAIDDSEAIEIEDVSLVDLVEAFGRIMESVNFDRLGDHTVTYDDTPLELHAEDLLHRLRTGDGTSPGPDGSGELALRAAFAGRTRAEAIGLFLAMLEMVKQQRLTFRVEPADQSIFLRLPAPEQGERAGPDVVVVPSAESERAGRS